MITEQEFQHRMQQIDRAFAGMGHTYSFEDVLALIDSGELQSFAIGDTWAVTQILDFPRKRVLEIVLVVGDMPEAEQLYDIVMAFARDKGCNLVRAYGREGWEKWAKPRGWQNGYRIFLKEV